VENYAVVGRLEDAVRLFERLLGASNDLGLFSEEFDPDRGELLGNFPQAFTHLGLLQAVRRLDEVRGHHDIGEGPRQDTARRGRERRRASGRTTRG
jgi:GH15 family glucan-1,4-alpha-glucosidase